MATETYSTQQYIQYGQYPGYYINGFGISNGLTLTTITLNIAPGSCLDFTGSFQLTSNSTISINSTVNGLNGLDQGTVAANKVYPIYLVWDPVTNNPPGAMLSLSYTTPLMPFGYSAYLLIGYATTNASAQILKGYWTAGNAATRTFTYDNPLSVLSSGSSSSPAIVDLTKAVPNYNNTPVSISAQLIPNASGDILSLKTGAGTSNSVSIIGQVAGTALNNIVPTLAQVVSISGTLSPAIQYSVTAGGAITNLLVANYTWYV